MKPTILAMDLEGTLISNAVSQIPRPGLFPFLQYMRAQFSQLVIFTTVPEPLARRICSLLVAESAAPTWFAQLPYIFWEGPTKDLRFVTSDPCDAILLDDYAPYVHPGQESQWVEIPLFGSPYADDDIGLDLARLRIHERLARLSHGK
ncbi:NIF family HAD-type phosphatase [Stenotrophomonas sp. Iso1]|uniref:NIF family HAD-type phosphatase n=1 Tax=Stenotrophomonas sp. Iso1 TaxID=2977283 RepID=UPI0022B7A69D|nr:NIF family HAD-type phosphatase [Stenotrophomonas sp. Iso1]